MLQYKLELFEQGYTVVNGDVHYECLPSRCKPITMTTFDIFGRPCANAENLIGHVDVDWEGHDKEFFYTHYEDILRGKYPEWKIISFSIKVGYLCLSFYNFETKESGYLLLGGSSEREPGSFKVRFELPRDDGGPESRYLVSIAYGQNQHCPHTMVTEYGSRIRREFIFAFKKRLKTNAFSDKQCAYVTEYVDV